VPHFFCVFFVSYFEFFFDFFFDFFSSFFFEFFLYFFLWFLLHKLKVARRSKSFVCALCVSLVPFHALYTLYSAFRTKIDRVEMQAVCLVHSYVRLSSNKEGSLHNRVHALMLNISYIFHIFFTFFLSPPALFDVFLVFRVRIRSDNGACKERHRKKGQKEGCVYL